MPGIFGDADTIRKSDIYLPLLPEQIVRYYTLISGKRSWGVPEDRPCEMLEPYDGKLSRTVLRGEWGGNAPDLPGPIMEKSND